MSRPADVTQEMIDRWEQDRQTWIKTMPAGEFYPPEAFYSSCYMDDRLMALGCPKDLIESIVMAAGQRQAGRRSDDMWPIAIHVIEEYKQGRWEMPGPELAEKILRENNQDPIELLKTMASIIPDKGKFFETLMVSRYVHAYK